MADKPSEEKKLKKQAEVVAEVAPAEAEKQPSAVLEVKPAAKAGKRSAKALKEAGDKQVKEARKKDAAEAGAEKAKPQAKPKSRLERAGKKYRELAKQIDKTKTYPLAEALDLASKTSPVKFDATVELHINLAVDPKQADQNVRGNVTLPAGTGKNVRVAVFAEADAAGKAKTAGADIVGENEVLAKLDKEQLDFDVLITSPNLMPRLGKYAKLLGPRGLMPNPKSGTITNDIEKAVTEAKAGKSEYRVDSAGIIHMGIGKVSFGPEKLVQNAEVVLSSVRAAKPASVKSAYISSIYVTTSMGPSIKVAI